MPSNKTSASDVAKTTGMARLGALGVQAGWSAVLLLCCATSTFWFFYALLLVGSVGVFRVCADTILPLDLMLQHSRKHVEAVGQ